MKILINRGNTINAKSYPYWDRFIELAKKHEIKEINGILPIKKIEELVDWCNVWISIDSFLPHLCAYKKLKSGIVLWGKSDPELFGYKHNINLLGDRKFLKKQQYQWWKDEPINNEVFVSPETVIKSINTIKQ